MTTTTYGQFFTDMWNTEMFSWDSVISLLVLIFLVTIVGVSK